MQLAVVINPAAGQDVPVLATLNDVCARHGVDWEALVTHRDGDARRLAREAAEGGADVVAVYGGDGTVSEVATGLCGHDVPLAVLPGGTGNAVAQELGIPMDLAGAVELACLRRDAARPVDTMRVDERRLLLRIGVGADAEIIRSASRAAKDQLGWLAYLAGAFAQIREESNAALYRLHLDGELLEAQAFTCVVANIGRLGRGGLKLAREITPFDGWLDVLILRDAGAVSLAAFAARALGAADTIDTVEESEDAPLLHLRASEVRIEADPEQGAHGDGELFGTTPLVVRVAPQDLRIVLPEADPWAG
jgi:YegS/Rv2252/BmrU family lipid kinase